MRRRCRRRSLRTWATPPRGAGASPAVRWPPDDRWTLWHRSAAPPPVYASARPCPPRAGRRVTRDRTALRGRARATGGGAEIRGSAPAGPPRLRRRRRGRIRVTVAAVWSTAVAVRRADRRRGTQAMTRHEVPSSAGPVPVFVAVPEGRGPWPGVVLLHDAGCHDHRRRLHARDRTPEQLATSQPQEHPSAANRPASVGGSRPATGGHGRVSRRNEVSASLNAAGSSICG